MQEREIRELAANLAAAVERVTEDKLSAQVQRAQPAAVEAERRVERVAANLTE